jgi:N-methylhydantoinase A
VSAAATRICGIDTGGTFTDLALVDGSGALLDIVKTPSTPGEFEVGVLDALGSVSSEQRIDVVAHGTTVGTNAVLEARTPPVALLTTAGCGDIVFQMRGSGRVAGLPVEQVGRVHETAKPAPLVDRSLVFEVDERIDCFGDVVVGLDPDGLRGLAPAIERSGVRAVAISFLWSFLNPVHEELARDVLAELLPDVQISLSSRVAPRLGEYERTTATILNASLSPVIAGYVGNLSERVGSSRLYLMQSSGGTISAAEAVARPLHMLDSGPVGGIVASRALGRRIGVENVIATDMGGTSLDVGIVQDGLPLSTRSGVVRQFEYFVSAVQVESIGAGGGSIASIDELTGNLLVGPASAGSLPGPACYGRGGTQPTVTDADVVLGRLNPSTFLGGRMRLDVAAAEASVRELASALGLSVEEAASGIVSIVDNRMADLIHGLTVRRGLDIRDFVLFAYGGAGPCHVGGYAGELGCDALVPLGNAAAVWSAMGIAQADVGRVLERTLLESLPCDAAQVGAQLDELEQQALEDMGEQGVGPAAVVVQREADVRYKGQFYELPMALPPGRVNGAVLDDLGERFLRRYEEVYGRGAGFRGAQLELVSLRVRAAGSLLERADEAAAPPVPSFAPEPAATREVVWSRGFEPTPVYGADAIVPGARVAGPAVVDLADTTVCVHPRQTLDVDALGNLWIRS